MVGFWQHLTAFGLLEKIYLAAAAAALWYHPVAESCFLTHVNIAVFFQLGSSNTFTQLLHAQRPQQLQRRFLKACGVQMSFCHPLTASTS